MAQLDEHARRLCNVCGQPFYDPEQGSMKDYHYTARYVSDNHRAMFHSGNEIDLKYDPDYYAAHDRIQRAQEQSAARVWKERVEGAEHMVEITRKALDSTKEAP